MKKTLFTFVAAAFAIVALSGNAMAANSIDHAEAPEGGWQHDGPFGTFDRSAAQRGLQVYREVCASCHGLKQVSFRTLSGISFSEAEIKAIAADYTFMADPNQEGDVLERAGLPFDYFPDPYPNPEAAAYSNNGATPPDLSLMAKKRVGGESYIYSLLTHYREPTVEDMAALEKANITIGDTAYFNPIKSGNQLAMAPPLYDEAVEYAEGQPEATVDQMAKDVSVFLTWAAEPTMEERKDLGFRVMAFLIILCGIMFFAYRRIARRVHGH
jgi:ubiquinol-cytochrome c reductase cytochrome c1 subunit